MPLLIALIGAAITAFVWYNRAQRGAVIARDFIDTAADVKNAARRFGFRRRANQHPVEGIDDPALAVGGLAVAFLEMDDLPTADLRTRMDLSLRKHLNIDAGAAREIAILGRWFVEECKGPAPAFPRLAKRLKRIDGTDHFNDLMAILTDIAGTRPDGQSARQSEALGDLSRIFRIT